ncbi:MAG TPA: family 10 glycosylhydrolase [Phycisphaerae bacterium]|nr:family 10 glycosylhydrolase [Phycisphaerae bacterium]HOJ73399.1 family 10 glycosylhydrolase [Phycisphaerae bacterium]
MSQGRLEFVLCSVSAKPLVRWISFFFALVLTSSPVQAQEFRGMWVSRFEWPSTNLNTVKATIESIMTNLQTHRFNAVIFQVRGQCDTLYPSPYEPWSPILSSSGGTPSGWGTYDPMAHAIQAAHARGLEFHAYINTHVAWQGANTPPANHIWHQHFKASDPSKRDWLIHDSNGNPVQAASDNYVWIAPGVPAAQAYTRKQVMYVVQNYDVDGIHFDRIRMPSPDYSYDPISLARFAGEGNPHGLGFADWTRDQFTRFCCDMYAQIMEVKPHIKVSSAPLGLYRQERYPGYPSGFLYGYTRGYQDAQAWIKAGAMDFLVPQIYWADGGNLPDFSDLLPDWVANTGGRHIYAGHNISTGINAIIQDIDTCRSVGAQGNVIWSYNAFNNTGSNWTALSGSGKRYAQPAALPTMPWKTNPTTGIILGTVMDAATGQPVVDAHVTRSQLSNYVALSSGDGLYSFLLVPPGTYTLTFNKPGVGNATVGNVVVTAGGVTRVDVALSQTATCSISAQPDTVKLGRTITFTPLVQVPAGQSVLSHTWHLDEISLPGTGMPIPIEHVYEAPGIYTVRLELAATGSGTVFSNPIEVTVLPAPADMDGDQDVDMDDFAVLQACLSGTTVPQDRPECVRAKLDGDSDVDLEDVNLFIRCLSGPNRKSDPFCIP